MNAIGAYQAKTHLPRLLDRVQRGETLTITRHGRPVARLVPVEADERTRVLEAVAQIRELRAELHAQGKTLPVAELIAMTREGHRY